MLLMEFKDSFLELLLGFLWRQWSQLGVAGYAEGKDGWVIDPEALLAFTATIGRYDQRLFDEVLDWLAVNGRFINVQRLRTILRQEGFSSIRVLQAIAGLFDTDKAGVKWKGLAGKLEPVSADEETALFFLKGGQALPVVGDRDPCFLRYGFVRNPVVHRGLSRPFSPGESATLLLQLRALVGLNSRAEILLYLLVNGNGTIQTIAGQGYYAWRSIQETLFEMGHAGLLNFSKAKRGRIYHLDAAPLKNLLLKNGSAAIRWICWPPLFRALELVWETVRTLAGGKASALEQAAALRRLMDGELLPRFEKAGIMSCVPAPSGYHEAEYLGYWVDAMRRILEELHCGA